MIKKEKGFGMQVNGVSLLNAANFTGHDERKTGGAGKAWCSTFVPGLGQFLDGRNSAGAGFMAGEIGLAGITSGLYLLTDKFAKTEKSPIVFAIGTGLSAIALIALKLVDIVNAYKGDKHKN